MLIGSIPVRIARAAALRTIVGQCEAPDPGRCGRRRRTLDEAAVEIKSTWPAMQVSLISASRAGDFSSAKVEKALRRDLTRLGRRTD
jgi:hypothetical protein